MFGWRNITHADDQALTAAIWRVFAVAEFNMDGTIRTANDQFLNILGYSRDEIVGRHHRMFMLSDDDDSEAYLDFWTRLRRGECQVAEYKRMAKGERAVWIQASYIPILGSDGSPKRVIEIGADATTRKLNSLADAGQIAAIERSQAVIHFNLDGTIIKANQNFLDIIGYSLEEIVGKNDSMFVSADPLDRDNYDKLWERLRRGEYQSGEMKRLGKGSRDIWIFGSCTPIVDEKGAPFAVVQFATDITNQKLEAADYASQIEAIRKSQAVIEFRMDGTIISANQQFLHVMGYTLAEVRGRHHSMFVESADRDSVAYAQFWSRLNAGEYQRGEFRRLAKGGRGVWIEASYNPILDLNGKPLKVVKYAVDVTEKTTFRLRAEQARLRIDAVAAGSEQMSASIREISETMALSKAATGQAVIQTSTAREQAERLNQAAQSMEGIVDLIGSITGQINLLALNATIESARAGEAGRGFAVVAGEVKSLAGQARHATEKITDEIGILNDISGQVVVAVNNICAAIGRINDYATSISAAAEEQSVVTSEMSANMHEAASQLAG